MRIFFILLLLVVCAEAKEVAVYDNAASGIFDAFKDVASSWQPTMINAGYYLVSALAVFELIYVYANMALDGKLEPAGVMGQLMKTAFVFGLFMGLIFHVEYLTSFINGIESIASKATHSSVTPDTIVDRAGDIWVGAMTVVDSLDLTAVSTRLTIFFVAFIAVLAILGIGLTLLIVKIKAIIFVASAPIWLGFGVFQFTRQWGINTIVAFIKIGAELFFLKIIVSLAVLGLMGDINAMVSKDGGLILLVIKAAAFFSIAKMVSGFVDSIFSGSTMGNASGAGQALKAIAIGGATAIAGAATGAATARQAANAAAPGADNASTTTQGLAAMGGAVSGMIKGTAQSFGIGSGANGAGENTGKGIEMTRQWASSLGKDKEKPKSNAGNLGIKKNTE